MHTRIVVPWELISSAVGTGCTSPLNVIQHQQRMAPAQCVRKSLYIRQYLSLGFKSDFWDFENYHIIMIIYSRVPDDAKSHCNLYVYAISTLK